MNTKINAYNVYQDGTKLIGISDEVTLPDFDALTETLSGPGILGEIDDPLLGHFGAADMDIPFRTMDDQAFKLLAAGNAVDLTFRISTQAIEETDLSTDFMPSRIVIRGKSKGFSGGSLKQGQGTGSSVKVEILYFLYEINGNKRFELDKLNFVYKVNGVDLLEKVRSQC
ncbi:MAG: phage major tail tube protein [Coprobacillus sp.]|nr:phage major tail tube protein [Coprobacillus sp.]